MSTKIIPFLFILIASCFNNLIIPYLIYYKKFGLFKKRPPGFVGVNFWGIIMDGILAGGINIIILNYLLEIKPAILLSDLIISLIGGLIFMITSHIYMSVAKWKVWIMPKPWTWNLAGYWHMISMTLQMSYAAYCLLIIFRNPSLFFETLTVLSLGGGIFLTGLFLLALRHEKKGIKIGLIRIDNQPW